MRRVGCALVALLVLSAGACSSSKNDDNAGTTTVAAGPTGTITGTTPTTAGPSAFPAATQQGIDSVVTAIQNLRIPGAVVHVDVPGQGSYTTAAGDAATGAPTTTDTHFNIGSITKTFTGTVVLQLVDQGKLKLTDTLNTWASTVPNAEQITITQMLQHTSGIYDYADATSFNQALESNPSQTWTPQQLVDLAVQGQPYFAPGQGWHYSNTNFVLLGMIIQQVTGQDPAAVIQSQVLEPLGLQNTALPTSATLPAPAASGNNVVLSSSGTDPQVQSQAMVDPSAFWTAGGMYSTVGDLQIWAQALAEGTLLSASSQQTRLSWVSMNENIEPINGTGNGKSVAGQYGLAIWDMGGPIGHDGEIPGWNAAVFYLPSSKATIVVLLNGEVFEGSTPQPVAPMLALALAEVVAPDDLTYNT